MNNDYKKKFVTCRCGTRVHPFKLQIVYNAWVKKGREFYQFPCTKCSSHIIMEIERK